MNDQLNDETDEPLELPCGHTIRRPVELGGVRAIFSQVLHHPYRTLSMIRSHEDFFLATMGWIFWVALFSHVGIALGALLSPLL